MIDACRELRVPRLVYTSTYNVIYGGLPIPGGDESLPYFPLETQHCVYSRQGSAAGELAPPAPLTLTCLQRTKAMAEQRVLAADGTPLEGPTTSTSSGDDGATTLHTCAVRPAAIYGPGEMRHLPRQAALQRSQRFLPRGKIR